MFYYALIGVSIVVIGLFFCKDAKSKGAIFLLLAMLIFFAGFRGAFTTDYPHYLSIFENINDHYSFAEALKGNFYQEKGFILFVKTIGAICNSKTFFMFAMSAVTICLLYCGFRYNSKIPWLTILLFVSIGSYYESFNISRQILAASITFSGASLLYQRQFLKYSAVILVAALFHRTALCMIPLYFVLTRKITVQSIAVTIMITVFSSIALISIINYIKVLFPAYSNYTYGMSGGSPNWLVVPVALLLFVIYSIICRKVSEDFNINSNENRIMINGLVVYVVFIILGMQVGMVARLSSYVQPFSWVLISNILYSYRAQRGRQLITLAICVLAVLYPLVTLSDTGYEPYYFIWS